MRKLHLIAMSYDKDKVLNALQRTGAVEVVSHAQTENTVTLVYDTEQLRSRLSTVEAALFALSTEVENYERENHTQSGLLKDGFDVSYSDFMSAWDNRAETERAVEKINALVDEKNTLLAELSKCIKEKGQAEIYAGLTMPFSAFLDTAHTHIRLGTVAAVSKDSLLAAVAQIELCDVQTLDTDGENVLLLVVSHVSVKAETDGLLSSFGFADCPYTGEKTGQRIYTFLTEKEKSLHESLQKNAADTYALKDMLHPLKIYADYLGFTLEKEETSDKLRATDTTFLLQAYLPEDAEEQVTQALKEISQAIYFECSDPTEDDTPPTLLRNNKLVESFEGITNTYSAPNYREFDPNAVMAVFYSLFMGFIIGDAGYGLLMAIVGGLLWYKNLARPTGMSRLAGAFACGGIFAIIWGLLFNSLFGIGVLPVTLMPNPQTDMWHLAGIAVPSVLIISMELGVAQIFVGYICKAVQEWRRGGIVDGICDGVLWALFSVGIGLAIIGFLEEAALPVLATVGAITAGVSLILAMLTAGRKEKFFGKFTKGFGAAYGVINYASDILSYARLYGLMLSGAVIAQIIAQYSGQFITSGNVLLIALGILILLVGHGFNLVMNLLGAYIHDARLQYVEFYGRFFEGEGELFKPLGSQHKYVYVTSENVPSDGK